MEANETGEKIAYGVILITIIYLICQLGRLIINYH